MDIYRKLRERNLTSSLRDYSENWLGMAHNYASANRDGFSLQAVVHLYNRLYEEGQLDLAEGCGKLFLNEEILMSDFEVTKTCAIGELEDWVKALNTMTEDGRIEDAVMIGDDTCLLKIGTSIRGDAQIIRGWLRNPVTVSMAPAQHIHTTPQKPVP